MTPELPANARLDERRGQRGAQYVVFTCTECGKEFRKPLWYLTWCLKTGTPTPMFCGRQCQTQAARGAACKTR